MSHHIYVTFDLYVVQSVFLALEALQMLVIRIRDKHMKMAKNVDGFSAALWPKKCVWGEF